MTELTRVWRRLTGHYVPYLQPFWEDDDHAVVAAWLRGEALPGTRDMLAAALRAYFPGCTDIILTDTGKTGLVVVLKGLAVAADREVIVPSYCCSSVVASVVRAGCVPVLADVDDEFNLAADSVAEALSSRTAAILVPHLFGRRARSLARIVDLARPRGIAVIEDVTQAFGLQLAEGIPAGAVGDAAIFSAGPGKPIMGPGGGWAMFNRPAAKMEPLREEVPVLVQARLTAFLRRFTGPRWRRGQEEIRQALGSRLTASRQPADNDLKAWAWQQCRNLAISDVEAWLAARQIARIGENLHRRRAQVARWGELLAKHGVACELPAAEGYSCAILPIIFPDARQATVARRVLESGGVATEPCYTPLHLRPHGRNLRRTNMARTEDAWRRVFAVPVRPNLEDADWRVIDRAVAVLG